MQRSQGCRKRCLKERLFESNGGYFSNKLSLPELAARAKLSIEQDALLPPEEKRSRKAWVLKVLTDNSSSDSDKRSVLADYILSGQRASDTI
jgi:hypothetical protein